jgi:hypothetical protein
MPGPTHYADEAFQIAGQPAYDFIMKQPEYRREKYYNKLRKYGSLNFFLTPTFFADEAFQIAGQPAYDYIMKMPEDKREKAYKKLKKHGSLNFFLTPTFFADEAFQIAGQPAYDYIMKMPEDKREKAYKKLKKHGIGHCHPQRVDVGPIWGNHEAAEKVKHFIDSHPQYHGWVFTGAWNSENGTSFAELQQPRNRNTIKVEVGPIYGGHEAEQKIRAWMAGHHRYHRYVWTGEW